jgi:streptogramin lyase
MRRLAAVTTVVPAALLLLTFYPTTALASGAGTVTNFPMSGYTNPYGITAGPDGNLWFTEYSGTSGSAIGSITPSGNITSYPVSGTPGWGPIVVTPGPDGSIWFTGGGPSGYVGRITTSGSFTEVAPAADPGAITTGPHGAVWFTTTGGSSGSIGRIDTSGTVTTFTGTNIDFPHWITAGPDGKLWFTNYGNNTIGRISASGTVKDFSGPGISQPQDITAAPGGALWFTNPGNNSIGLITTSGKVSNFTGAGISDPEGITAGPDGEVPRAFRTVHPLGWAIWKGDFLAPTEEELLTGIQGRGREDGDRDIAPDCQSSEGARYQRGYPR